MPKFNPEVKDYMQLHGFTEHENPILSYEHLLFKKGEIGVQFFQDKIEKIDTRTGKVLTSFKGFDGQDTFTLMVALHIMKAISLKDFALMCKEDGIEIESLASSISLTSLIAKEAVTAGY